MKNQAKVKKYPYGKIEVLAQKLEQQGIAPDIIAQIMEGGETIQQGSSGEQKAAWMREAMRRMDKLLDRNTRYGVREQCACCLGGKRHQLVKEIAKRGGSLEERVQAANEARLVFGHSVALQEDGSVLVRFAPDGQPGYRCPCLPKAEEVLPITYCYCCGGHVKHHLQVALGRKLAVKVRSSVLSSGGKRPCNFVFTFVD
jgi:hypothetical protein